MADIDFSWMDDLLSDDTDYGYLFDDSDDGAVSLDYDYDPNDYGIGSFNINDLFSDFNMTDLLDDNYNFTDYSGPGTAYDQIGDYLNNLYDDKSEFLDLDTFKSAMNKEPGYEDMLESFYENKGLGSLEDYLAGAGKDDEYIDLKFPEDPSLLERVLNFLSGNKDKKKGEGKGILQGQGQLFGGSGLETLIKLAMINKLRKQDRDDPNEVVPIGSDAFAAVGQGQGLGTMPDYRVFNLQPALMPGVGYANAPPPGMKQGGVSDGPGDITLARLEPGEFVMTRKATDNIGAKNLYKLMKDAERMS